MRSQVPAELRITETLKAPTELEFIETPLVDVVDFLKDMHAVEIQFDARAIDDIGIPIDTPITKNLKGLSLKSSLRLMLRDLDLSYVVRDEVLLITSREAADAMMETHVYSLHRLAGFESDALAEVIENSIRPDTWVTGEPFAAVNTLPGCLVITQSQQAHEEIADLLRQLETLDSTSHSKSR